MAFAYTNDHINGMSTTVINMLFSSILISHPGNLNKMNQ